MICDYQMICVVKNKKNEGDDHLQKLTDIVLQLMDDDWEPMGAVTIEDFNNCRRYIQVMVKREKIIVGGRPPV